MRDPRPGPARLDEAALGGFQQLRNFSLAFLPGARQARHALGVERVGKKEGMEPKPPSRAEVLAAAGKTVPDVIAPGLRVLFCGINPGLYSGATGHHFARPGNRFWPVLHRAGFTARRLAPWDERELLDSGYGITNLVARATATAAELEREEFLAGARRLEGKVKRYRPQWVAVVGIGAYRAAFGRPKALIGPQEERLGPARLWLLPQPSGLNANHQMPELAKAFRALRKALG